jgi:hypothetical protein
MPVGCDAFFPVAFFLVAFFFGAFFFGASFLGDTLLVDFCLVDCGSTPSFRNDRSPAFFIADGAGWTAFFAAALAASSATLRATAGGTGVGWVACAATGNAAGAAVEVCGSGMALSGASGAWAKLRVAHASRAAVHNRVRVVVMVHGFLADS